MRSHVNSSIHIAVTHSWRGKPTNELVGYQVTISFCSFRSSSAVGLNHRRGKILEELGRLVRERALSEP